MNFPRFFINRPIFAIVLSVLMLIAGAISYFQLPLSEYPQVTPPTVQVTASYPGANPQVIADTVASPLEQAINGVEGMMYMQSQMSTDGKMVLTVSFEQHINADIAQIRCKTGSRRRCRAYRLKFSASVLSPRKRRRTFSWWCICFRLEVDMIRCTSPTTPHFM